VPDSPAAKAGVKVGDRIVSVKGKTDAVPEDGEATVTVERGGETLKLKAVFGKGL
jgi:C-terminal processing protease CtpA/Prc